MPVRPAIGCGDAIDFTAPVGKRAVLLLSFDYVGKGEVHRCVCV